MAVKDVLKKKVPAYVKETPEWSVFLRWISQKNVTTTAQLKRKLDEQIMDCQADLKTRMKDGRQGTNSIRTRQYAKRLDFLKLVRDKIVKRYL